MYWRAEYPCCKCLSKSFNMPVLRQRTRLFSRAKEKHGSALWALRAECILGSACRVLAQDERKNFGRQESGDNYKRIPG